MDVTEPAGPTDEPVAAPAKPLFLCPFCGANATVVRTRSRPPAVTRLRKCSGCGRRFGTTERLTGGAAGGPNVTGLSLLLENSLDDVRHIFAQAGGLGRVQVSTPPGAAADDARAADRAG